MTAPILSVRKLAVAYGKVEAVRSVSLDLPRGTIVTVIGANGAGKSTLLNALMGLLPATGSVLLEGREQLGRPIAARISDKRPHVRQPALPADRVDLLDLLGAIADHQHLAADTRQRR